MKLCNYFKISKVPIVKLFNKKGKVIDDNIPEREADKVFIYLRKQNEQNGSVHVKLNINMISFIIASLLIVRTN